MTELLPWMETRAKDPDLALLLELYGVNPQTLYEILGQAFWNAEKRPEAG